MSPNNRVVSYCPLCRGRIRERIVRAGARDEYGCPKVTCPCCGQETTDEAILELAIHPREWYDTHLENKKVSVLLLFLPWILMGAVIALLFDSDFARSTPGILLGIMILAPLVLGSIPYFRYSCRRVNIRLDEDFSRAYDESEARLRDPQYKQFLMDSGYAKRHGVEYIM